VDSTNSKIYDRAYFFKTELQDLPLHLLVIFLTTC